MDWSPFILCQPGVAAPQPRSIGTAEGLGDRMRTAAFAEYQAIRAFTWAAARYDDVPSQLRQDWLALVREEERHYQLITRRMRELGVGITDRPVSVRLWDSLLSCTTGRQFCLRMVNAEERGRQAGLRLIQHLAGRDPATSAVFEEIVADEISHIALGATYFG